MTNYYNAIEELADVSTSTGPQAEADQDWAFMQIDKALNPDKYTVTFIYEDPPATLVTNAAIGGVIGATGAANKDATPNPTVILENPPPPIVGGTLNLPVIEGTVGK